jgi:hypothetical protein
MENELISGDVAAAFALKDFTSWGAVARFADEEMKKLTGLSRDDDGFGEKILKIDAGYYGAETKQIFSNYMHINIGARYLEETDQPFPEKPTQGLFISAAGIQSMLMPLETSLILEGVSKAFNTIRQNGLETEGGRKAADQFHGEIKKLKLIVPKTSWDSISTVVPLDVPVHPEVLAKLNELAALAIGGSKDIIVEGKRHSLN